MNKAGWKLGPRAQLEADEGGESGILFDSYTATLYACNRTAWTLVTALAAGADMEELVSALAKQFEVSEDEARKDIFSFMNQIKSMDLLDG